MKNYLQLVGVVILMMLCSFNASAQWTRPNTSYGTRQFRLGVDSALMFPTGCGAPTRLQAVDIHQFAIYGDSCSNTVYYYNPKTRAWYPFGDGGSGTRVDSLTLVDSVLCAWQGGVSICAKLAPTKVFVKKPLTVDSTTNPGYQTLGERHDDGLVSGGIVTSAGCLSLHVTSPGYYLNGGIFYTAPAITLTVSTPNGSLPRKDRIVADTFGVISIIPGLPATLPQDPPYNPASQWSIATYPVAAGATCLSISSKIIYDETGGSEYTPSTSGTITASASNTANPEHLTIALYVQSYADSAQVIFTKPSGQDTVFNNSLFRFGLYLNNPFQGHQLQMQLFLAGVPVTSNIVVNPYISVFDTLEYQTVAVPWYAFGASGNIIYDKVVFTLRGSDLSGASGLFFDYFQLQTGITNSTPSLYLTTDSTSGPATLVGNHLNVPNYASGGGSTNVNIGAGFRLAVPGTNNIKTLFNGYAVRLDSSSNTNGITLKADTSLLLTKLGAAAIYLTSIDTTNIANFSTKVHSLFSATAPITYNSGTGRVAITQSTTSTDGYLSSTDWNTFNNKGGSTTTADSTLIATGGQTAFTFTAVPGAYTDYIIFVNGASIEPVTYFTTSSNTITFSIGLVVGDRVRYKRIK